MLGAAAPAFAPAPVDEDREKRCAEVVRLLVQSSPEVSTAHERVKG